MIKRIPLYLLTISLVSSQLISCGGGSENQEVVEPPPAVIIDPPPPPPPDDLIYSQAEQVARFLNQSTFGATLSEIEALTDESLSLWYKNQLSLPPSYLLPVVDELAALTIDDEINSLELSATTIGFWRHAISADDQLRQRVAFALSEILVVSNGGGDRLTEFPTAVAYYQDLLIEHAFGNYRDLLDVVTYSPAMGFYLTYLGSKKADPQTGRMPDENYARELLQLFTIGVIELNSDGSPRLNEQGNPIETYNNDDITGLAKVFTGLNINAQAQERSTKEAAATPMEVFPEYHSLDEKSFLGTTIAENTEAEQSITLALDHIFAHANVAPFLAEQLIQRLVMSNPSEAYIARVANVFDLGEFALPNGDIVGDGRRGDLAATTAAILFDEEAQMIQGSDGGKLREPILRFTHWARAFNVDSVTPEFQLMLFNTSSADRLSQHPYRAPSVFNFFRPGYIAPNSLTGDNNLKAPELQIVNASSVAGYNNFMTHYIFATNETMRLGKLADLFEDESINIDLTNAENSFVADYQRELTLVTEPDQLLDHLSLILTHNTLSETTREHILNTLSPLPTTTEQQRLEKVQLAVLLVMTSPDYLIQQ